MAGHVAGSSLDVDVFITSRAPTIVAKHAAKRREVETSLLTSVSSFRRDRWKYFGLASTDHAHTRERVLLRVFNPSRNTTTYFTANTPQTCWPYRQRRA